MEKYLVISPHTAAECKQALSQVMTAGYITHFEWGCLDGDHTGWAIFEAEDAKQALMVVPSNQRASAKVVRLKQFSAAEVKAMHAH